MLPDTWQVLDKPSRLLRVSMGERNQPPELAEQQSRRVALPVARHVRHLDSGVLKEIGQGDSVVTSVVRPDLGRQRLTQEAVVVRRAGFACDIANPGDGPPRLGWRVLKQSNATSELHDVARHLFVDISRGEVRVLDIVAVGSQIAQKLGPLTVGTNEQVAK